MSRPRKGLPKSSLSGKLLESDPPLPKPAGARPGMVTYDNYRTLYVTPEEGLAKKLSIR